MDFSGNINGLLIFSSIGLGLAQFFYTDQRTLSKEIASRVEAYQRRLSDFLSGGTQAAPVFVNYVKSTSDKLNSEKHIRHIGKHLAVLFSMVVLSGIVKTLDAFRMVGKNVNLHFEYLDLAIGLFIACVSATLVVLVLCVGLRLFFNRKRLLQFDEDVGHFCSMVDVLVSSDRSGHAGQGQ